MVEEVLVRAQTYCIASTAHLLAGYADQEFCNTIFDAALQGLKWVIDQHMELLSLRQEMKPNQLCILLVVTTGLGSQNHPRCAPLLKSMPHN